MAPTGPPRPFWSPGRLALALAAAAALAVLLTLRDPGITTDEPLDVRPGRTYVRTLWSRGLGFFRRDVVEAVFRDNAEHPPLGRWLLGLASVGGEPFEAGLFGADPVNLYVASGRLAPAFGFAALVGLVTHAAARRYGTAAGVAAGFSLLVMPRCFAHAHIAALDTFITVFWVLALLAADRALGSRRPVLGMAGAGALWALALLTKIHAWFLIPVVLVWAFVRLGRTARTLGALAAWLACGLTLFVLGWPWLWFDPVPRLLAYLGTGVERASIRVLYFGTVYADRDVPWHYPWVYFLVTVPVGLLLLGFLGSARSWRERRRDPFPLLALGSILLFLVVFSTRVPVYDGERLFLMAFPLWAILIGRGFGQFWTRPARKAWARAGLAGLLASQAFGVIAYHPFGLSYYNALAGGLPGAERLGLELTYWGDAVDRVLLGRLAREAPAETRAVLVPSLYPGQGIASTTRAMAGKRIILGDQEALPGAGWVVISRRTAYWPAGVPDRLARGRLVFERRCRGVWLSAIHDLENQPR